MKSNRRPREGRFGFVLALILFQVLQPGVQPFLDLAQLCPPEFAHVVKALVDGRESLI
jgi:hypothetical protein